ncbi:hypothetical protein IX293_001725 [Fusobacterium necrophorum]|nr:ATP-grasp fold amidoligase family protein [Fusobacterium necrophorum]MBR8823455.1 hypothetical protein [Fusobacterium necrophorum]
MNKNKLIKSTIVIFIWRKLKLILFSLNPKLGIMIIYRAIMGEFPRLKKPIFFNEKIQWLKLNEYSKEIYSICTDKYLVRNYVNSKQCSFLLNELLFFYKKPEDIEFERFPKKFAIKLNHGCGYNIICKDKREINSKIIIDQLNKWLKEKPEKIYGEPQGKIKEKYILIEKYLGSKEGKLPKDYKFFCFNGRVKYIMYCDERETGKTKFYFFNPLWEMLNFTKEAKLYIENESTSIMKPNELNRMIEYAEKLSEDFYFVRVDFYYVEEKILFGELTFSPAGGLDRDLKYVTETGESVDEILGKELKLPIDYLGGNNV